MDKMNAELVKEISLRTSQESLSWQVNPETKVFSAPYDDKLTVNVLPYADFPRDGKASLTLTEGKQVVVDVSPSSELELLALRVLYRRIALQLDVRSRR